LPAAAGLLPSAVSSVLPSPPPEAHADAPAAAAAAPASRWRAWTALAGETLAQAPESAAYGLLALAPLGPSLAPAGLAAALLSAVIANPLVAALGAGGLVTAPRAALSLLTAALVGRLLATGGAVMTPGVVLALLAAGLVLAGALQLLFGVLRLGTVVKYTPHPVRVGLTSGVGLLLLVNAVPVVLGQPFGARWATALAHPLGGAVLVALGALAALVAAVRWRSPLPAGLVAMAAGVAVQALMGERGVAVGPTAGVPALAWPWFFQSDAPAVLAALPHIGWQPVSEVLLFAFTLAVLGSLDTLLTTSVVDGRLRRTRDANRELIAQGAAHLLVGLAGGMAQSPSVGRSVALLQAWPAPRAALAGYGVVLAAVLLLAPQMLGWLPLAAIGGVLVVQGAQMVDPWLWRTPRTLWQAGSSGARYDAAQRRLLLDNLGVAITVALTSLAMGLAVAVLVGAAFSVLLFVRANMREVVRRQHRGGERRSLKVRTPPADALLRREGRRIVVLELQGALFFGTGDSLRGQLDTLAAEVDTAVLDLSLVTEVDATGARLLLEMAADWARQGRTLVAVEWPAGDARRGVVEAIARSNRLPALTFLGDVDQALEAAEDRLLERFGLGLQAMASLALRDTLLAQGLDDAALVLLAQHLEPLRFAGGQHLFRTGDPADGLYVSLSGHIGIRLPGSARRLASFAPGVMVGELAVLERGARSADAVAETDVQVLRLSVAALDALHDQHPLLAARLMRNVSLHLAGRLRGLTLELSAWVARSAAAQAQAGPALVANEVADDPDRPEV
jgi:SulP family sulfate permease